MTAETNPPTTGLNVEQGTAYVFFAFDVGLNIDLTEASRALSEDKGRLEFKRNQRAPRYFNYDPLPLSIAQRAETVSIGGFKTSEIVAATVFDFGAISIGYAIDIAGPLAELVSLSAALYDNERLLMDARARLSALVERIKPAIERLDVSDLYDDYFNFHIGRLSEFVPLERLVADHGTTLAQILRCEPGDLSPDQVEDALSTRLSYSPEDLAIIDWNSAVIFGSSTDDVRAVCEFCNVELLEMRFLDRQLDSSLEQSYRALTSGKRSAADMRRVAQLQVDGAMVFESVNNALKLLGDQYLARLYSLASKRFHLADWDLSILRKLETIDSIYRKISDRQDQRRAEMLEWIIIILIFFEIVMGLLGVS